MNSEVPKETPVHPTLGVCQDNHQQPANAARQSGAQKIVISVLLLLATGVIFILPNAVTEPWINYSSETENTLPQSTTQVSPSTAAEKTKYRQDAQTLLAEIINYRDRLQQRAVELWGQFEFEQAMLAIERGDSQYQYGEYAESVASYQQALDGLSTLQTRGETILEQAISDTREAIEQNNLNTANSEFQLANAMAPDNSQVQQLTARVASLPQLIEAMERGQEQSLRDQLDSARQAYQQAVTLDPRHKNAAAALANTEQKIIERQFRSHMSRGFSALDRNNFEQAASAFNRAGKVYANHPAVAQALAQLETRRSQFWVNSKMARAEEFIAREKWQQASAIYEELLQTDSTLTDARVRQIPVAVRADLDKRIENILEDPLSLAASAVYQRAKVTLQDASGIANPGPLLQSQIAQLEKILKTSQTPVEVTLVSDSNTDVILFRVARLGSFERTSVSLKPGRYLAAGTRAGYRDVQVEFTVTDKGFDTPIIISCNEAI